MKLVLLLMALCLVFCLASGLDNSSSHKLNRPKFDIYGARQKRRADEGVKGYGTRVHPLFQFPRKKPELSVRKGEYICGNKVCKLQPGVVPKNCNGVCQYPLL